MVDLATLRDLHRRLREATGPDRNLDEAIAIVAHNWTNDRKVIGVACPAPATASIDAVVALIEHKLPNCAYFTGKGRERPDDHLYGTVIFVGMSMASPELGVGEHPTHPSIAACLAFVSALIAISEEKERADG